MRTIDAIRRSGVAIERDRTIREAAEIMDVTGIGSLAVLDGKELVGIVTDRDLVCRGIAQGLPLDARVDAVMSSPVISIGAGADLHETFALFRTHGVRRLAVMRAGWYVGMITVDDLLVDLSADLFDLSRPIRTEIQHPQRESALPATT